MQFCVWLAALLFGTCSTLRVEQPSQNTPYGRKAFPVSGCGLVVMPLNPMGPPSLNYESEEEGLEAAKRNEGQPGSGHDGYASHASSSSNTLGSVEFPDGSVYAGTLLLGVPHGLGTLQWRDGSKYDGEWREGVMSGFGTFLWASGQRHDGEWKDGVRNGIGVKLYADGSSFDGFWRDGRKNGVGVFRAPPGLAQHGSGGGGGAGGGGRSRVRLASSKVPGFRGMLPHSTARQDEAQRPDGEQQQQQQQQETQPPQQWRELCSESSHPAFDSGPAPHKKNEVFIRKYEDGTLVREDRLSQEDIKLIFDGPVKPKKEHRALGDRVKNALFGEERVQQKKGQLLFKGMPGYALMTQLQLGVRYSIGLYSQSYNGGTGSTREPPGSSSSSIKMDGASGRLGSGKAALLPRDFQFVSRVDFPSCGSSKTPAHPSSDFKWRDYSPLVFRNLRLMWGINDADYMLSLGGSSALWQLNSPGKSGCMFFLSDCEKFIIKTTRKSEIETLLAMLPSYYRHMESQPGSLITRFYGVHGVKEPGLQGRTVRFLVMANLFCTDLQIHRKFDLKGSTEGRTAGDIDPNDIKSVFKDLDLDLTVRLPETTHQKLVTQLQLDSSFLHDMGVMDYSLLMGMHYPGRAAPGPPTVNVPSPSPAPSSASARDAAPPPALASSRPAPSPPASPNPTSTWGFTSSNAGSISSLPSTAHATATGARSRSAAIMSPFLGAVLETGVASPPPSPPLPKRPITDAGLPGPPSPLRPVSSAAPPAKAAPYDVTGQLTLNSADSDGDRPHTVGNGHVTASASGNSLLAPASLRPSSMLSSTISARLDAELAADVVAAHAASLAGMPSGGAISAGRRAGSGSGSGLPLNDSARYHHEPVVVTAAAAPERAVASAPAAAAAVRNFDVFSDRQAVTERLQELERRMRELKYSDERIQDVLSLARLKILGDRLCAGYASNSSSGPHHSSACAVLAAMQQARREYAAAAAATHRLAQSAATDDGKASVLGGPPEPSGSSREEPGRAPWGDWAVGSASARFAPSATAGTGGEQGEGQFGLRMAATAVAGPPPLVRNAIGEEAANGATARAQAAASGQQQVVLYLGVIDILQNYNTRKKFERGFKGIASDGMAISVAPPGLYAKRFFDFATQVFQRDKDHAYTGSVRGQISHSTIPEEDSVGPE